MPTIKPTNQNPSLLDIDADFIALDQLLDETAGEITPEIEEWFAELDKQLSQKLDGIAAYWRFCLARAAVCKEEAERCGKRAMTMENRVEHLKFRLKGFMQNRKVNRLETDRNTFRIQANGGQQPIDICPVEKLPAEFIVNVPRPNSELIREKLAAGGEIPGCQLLPKGEHIRLA